MVREVEQAVPREGQGKARRQDVLHDVLQVREMDSGWQRPAEAIMSRTTGGLSQRFCSLREGPGRSPKEDPGFPPWVQVGTA